MSGSFPFKKPIEKENFKPKESFWNILVVDDDESIHDVTKLVLEDKQLEGKTIKLFSVYSAKEAKEKLTSNKVLFTAAFVDVVMETETAGLDLVKWIREELKNTSIRLVLRTGQAGLAPEEEVIRDYDINDYRTKTELTSRKLITTTYNAIRGYRDISIIERSLGCFKNLIEASNHMLSLRDVKIFGSAALDHLLTLMDVDSSALYISHTEEDLFENLKHTVIACTGKFTTQSNSLDNEAISSEIKNKILSVFESKKHDISDDYFIGYYETALNSASVLYIEINRLNRDYFQTHLLELYATNIALILENILAKNEIEKTQSELMYIIGDAIEARSKETGLHVKRVALICEKMSQKLGESALFVKLITLAAPLHDLGKIAIPENIIHKPGKLDEQEWTIMKQHAEIGGELLSKSNTAIAKIGSRLARYHHENWDGSGYPEGLKENEIPLEARIMAIADVFDALGSKRSYKDVWADGQIKEYIEQQKSIKFDPKLTEIFLDNFDEFLAIRESYPSEA